MKKRQVVAYRMIATDEQTGNTVRECWSRGDTGAEEKLNVSS